MALSKQDIDQFLFHFTDEETGQDLSWEKTAELELDPRSLWIPGYSGPTGFIPWF